VSAHTLDQYITWHLVDMLGEYWLTLNPYMANISADSWLSVSQVLVECQSSIIRVLVDMSAITQLTLNWHTYQLTYWPILNRYPTNTWPNLNQYSIDTRQTVGWCIGLVSVLTQPILADILTQCWPIYWSMVLTNTAYSQHDLISV